MVEAKATLAFSFPCNSLNYPGLSFELKGAPGHESFVRRSNENPVSKRLSIDRPMSCVMFYNYTCSFIEFLLYIEHSPLLTSNKSVDILRNTCLGHSNDNQV